MLACKQATGTLGRTYRATKRWLNTREAPGKSDQRRALPLDAVLDGVAPRVAVSWPSPPPRINSLATARAIRAFICAKDTPSALALLRKAPDPPPRLLVHATVHALLRVADCRRAGALLLTFCNARAMSKAPRMHPATLEHAVLGLLKLVPREQGYHDWTRTAMRPHLLILNPHMVSDSALRTALDLCVQARKLMIVRSKPATSALWRTLVDQREWVSAALVFDRQAKDYQLLKTLPALLRDPDPDAPPLTPHDRDHLRRRLAVLRKENHRASRALFSDICHRVGGVIHNIVSRPESGLADERAAQTAAGSHEDETSLVPTRFLDNDPDGVYALAEIESRQPYPIGFGARKSKKPITPARAHHQVALALQALTILGALIDSRQIPFADIRSWVIAVGSIPPSLSEIQVWVPRSGHPRRVNARKYLRNVLENYASALPRIPHIYSEFEFGTSGFTRRGLKHKFLDILAGAPESGPDPALGTADAPRKELEATPVEPEDLAKDGHKKHELAASRKSAQLVAQPARRKLPKLRHFPPDDPDQAADDSLMPPPPMPTYDALLRQFLRLGGHGSIYEPLSAEASAQMRKYGYAPPKKGEKQKLEPESRTDALEARIQQHYHAPHSPNNPQPELAYPPHPLDFDKYPAPKSPPDPAVEEDTALARRRRALAAGVVRHMMYERVPPLPPWEAQQALWIISRRPKAFVESGLWDDIWAGDAQKKREAEVRKAEARRLRAEEWDLDGGWRAQWRPDKEEPEAEEYYHSGSGWGLIWKQKGDVGRSMLRRDERSDVDGDLEALNRGLAARAKKVEERSYYGLQIGDDMGDEDEEPYSEEEDELYYRNGPEA
ncbi:hypothetical protein B0H15DRAFT_945247 [Mycena belliarum]|uniref:Uncharacterized protein n=1 Tax=Mycena belliarum TaxID=1033014 RepID=A0AAD6UDX3_9AGAR|nr:hypothetical protein B0H15DRAFT_945247 [Mycena belliae]